MDGFGPSTEVDPEEFGFGRSRFALKDTDGGSATAEEEAEHDGGQSSESAEDQDTREEADGFSDFGVELGRYGLIPGEFVAKMDAIDDGLCF